jgi:ketosteroid isomerase-like protein
MELLQMKKLIALVLLACVCGAVVLAVPPQPSNDPTAVNAIRQLEQDMGDAMVRADIDKLNQIYADDFATVGASGRIITKQDLLRDFGSFHDKLESFENGPIDVQVFGNVAVAYGSVTEKRMRDGKDTSGEFVWMDLLENRDGKWVVVRTAGARVKNEVVAAGAKELRRHVEFPGLRP